MGPTWSPPYHFSYLHTCSNLRYHFTKYKTSLLSDFLKIFRMSSISAASVTFATLAKLPNNHQISGRNSGWSWSSFPSLKTSSSRFYCAATPETVDKVYEVVRKQLVLPAETQLSPATKFSELGADSLDTVEIVMGLEEQFDISVEEENAESITTIQEAADIIEKLVEAKTEKS